MNRKEITEFYEINANGVITSPGQFEGEPLYVVHFWQAYLEGCADRDNGTVIGFDITPEDREEFPEIPRRKRTIRLVQSDQGFITQL
jgi:hypothetical protein